jgi:hypothetical protein
MRAGTVSPRVSQITKTTRRDMSVGTLGPFLALAFGLTWDFVALLILFPSYTEAVFGELSTTNPCSYSSCTLQASLMPKEGSSNDVRITQPIADPR